MRLEQLGYLAAILEVGSFRRAAEELHVSQAALSESIRNLEREIGDRLLDRDRRGVKLTPVGADVMPHIRSMLESERALRDQASEYRTLSRGQVSLATVTAIASTILPKSVRAFNHQYPGIQTRITEAGSLDIRRQVADGRFDLGTVAHFPEEPPESDELDFTQLLQCSVVMCAPHGHPLLNQEKVSIEDVAKEPLILFRSGYMMHDLMLRVAGEEDLNVVYVTENSESCKHMISAGIGVTVLPELSVLHDFEKGNPGFTSVSLDGDHTRIFLSLIWQRHRYRTRAARAFGDFLAHESSLHPMHGRSSG